MKWRFSPSLGEGYRPGASILRKWEAKGLSPTSVACFSGVLQEELAERALRRDFTHGVFPREVVSRWANGQKEPRWCNVCAAARAFERLDLDERVPGRGDRAEAPDPSFRARALRSRDCRIVSR